MGLGKAIDGAVVVAAVVVGKTLMTGGYNRSSMDIVLALVAVVAVALAEVT